jgi:hypothetical protein
VCCYFSLLFNVYMDRITADANHEVKLIAGNMTNQAVEINYDNDAMNEILFADDQSLMNEDDNSLQLHTTALNSACNKYNMKISTSKTEVMKISREPGTLEIYVDDFKL